MDKKEIFRAAIEALNVKSGDIVTVISAWPNYELGWNGGWCTQMNAFVGKECTVVHVSKYSNGVQLEIYDSDEQERWWFPPYVLRKVQTAKSMPRFST